MPQIETTTTNNNKNNTTMCITMRTQLVLASFLILLSCAKTEAQSVAAPPPAGPDNITSILQKAGQYTSFIRLLITTQEAGQINQQLNNSNQGLTIFAPTDNSFSSLKPGTLNSLSDQQKVQLVQFHILPTMISTTQFQTISNPLRTQAGDSSGGKFPLNVTTSGNQVNITTGVVNATVANTVYSDSKLAVYQVDQVLLPLQLFPQAKVLAPALAPAESGKDIPASTPKASSGTDTDNASSATCLNHRELLGLTSASGLAVVLAAAAAALWF